jgi:PPOX class probable F420-dependent enzyme
VWSVVDLTPVQRKHVEKPYIATLASVRPDGSPHTAPVWYRYDAGAFLVLTEGSSRKARNINRDPRVELCIDDRERAPFHTVIVRGRASIDAYPGDAWRLALAVHYLGEENGRRYVETTPVSADEVLIRIEPEAVVGW